MVVTPSQQVAIRSGYFVLIAFALIRPLSLMAHNVSIGGVSVLELLGVGISYSFLIPILFSLRKYQANLIDFLILLFCLYISVSLCWGAEIRKVTQTLIPFLLYFSARMFITHTRQLNFLLFALAIGFLIPIAVSTVLVVLGLGIQMVEYLSKLPRHAGAFGRSHVLAYTMLFFSFFFCLAQRTPHLKNKAHFRFVFSIFLLLSIYCLYQSHTRTALIGFVIFWTIYLWGYSKKIFFVSIVLAIFAGFIYLDHINTLIWKTKESDLNRATSGRVTYLKKNLELFLDSSIPRKFLGQGFGHEPRFPLHNDYMSLLINSGIIGLFLYLFLLFKLLWDIFFFRDKKTKYLFGGILIATAVMNFGSNVIISRLELSQYLWFVMGIFYYIKQNAENS